MSYKAMAHIHSLNGEMTEITVLEEVGDNDYIVDYKGVKCHALFNWFNCTYYADDVYRRIEECDLYFILTAIWELLPLITTTVTHKRKTATSDTRFVTQLKSSVKTTA